MRLAPSRTRSPPTARARFASSRCSSASVRQVYYPTIFTWPIALAVVIRLLIWFVVPASRFASDEDSYFQIATALLQGHHDAFWPPVTGWLIALVRSVSGTDAIGVVRLFWVVMDALNVVLVHTLAFRAGRAMWPGEQSRAATLASLAALGYAVYLPAISYAQFATSEIPALFLTLLVLTMVTSQRISTWRLAAAGVMAGLLCLTRPSLLPLVLVVPAAMPSGVNVKRVVVFAVAASMAIGAHVVRNWLYAGEFTISTNSAYNLYIGNRDMYAEDLDLLHPRATPGQIEFRRQQFSGQLPPFTQSPSESQRLAVAWIRDHPATFVRRAIGRLARVFVPRTDVLELVGGEANAGATAPRSLALLAVTNGQWLVVLFGGLAGLAALRHRSREWFVFFAGVIAAAVVLCTVAISKPRYSFVFDPLLIICAAALWLDRTDARFTRGDRLVLALAAIFLIWAWAAFAIFAVSSRAAS